MALRWGLSDALPAIRLEIAFSFRTTEVKGHTLSTWRVTVMLTLISGLRCAVTPER